MDRQQKIALLQAIQAGKKNIQSLLPKSLKIKIKKVGQTTVTEKYHGDKLIDEEKFKELLNAEQEIKIKVTVV